MNKHGGYTGGDQTVLDFSVNINPLGMPEGLDEILKSALRELNRYPEISGKTALKAVSDFSGLPESNLILGNGAIELIYLFTRAVKPESAAIVVPAFNEYRRALEMNGCQTIESYLLTEDTGFKLDADAFLGYLRSTRPQAVFLCSPCNPTGVLTDRETISRLVSEADPGILWFIDESFIDFSDAENLSGLLLQREAERGTNPADENSSGGGSRQSGGLVLLRSLTKFYGLPGLRIGYAAGSRNVIDQMKACKEPWTINTLALKAAEYLPQTSDFASESRTWMSAERQRVFNGLEDIPGITVFPSQADFHLIRSDVMPAAELAQALLETGICVRTCEDFPGLEKQFIRAAVKMPEHNTRLISAIRQILGAS